MLDDAAAFPSSITEEPDGVIHHIPDLMDPWSRHSLVHEIGDGPIRGGEQQIAHVIRDDPVDLLWHSSIERAQPRLDVRHGKVQLGGRERTSEGRVRVAIDQYPLRALAQQHRFEAGQHGPRLGSMGSGANPEVDGWRGDIELVEEHLRHTVVVVLACMHQDFADLRRLSQGSGHDRRFDKLWPCTHDADDTHGAVRRRTAGTARTAWPRARGRWG